MRLAMTRFNEGGLMNSVCLALLALDNRFLCQQGDARSLRLYGVAPGNLGSSVFSGQH